MGYLTQRIDTCGAIAGPDHAGSFSELRHEVEYLETFTLGLLGETPDAYAALDLVGKYAESVASALRGRPAVAVQQSAPEQVSDGGTTVGDLVNGVIDATPPASSSIDLGDLIDSIVSLVELFDSFALPAQQPVAAQDANDLPDDI